MQKKRKLLFICTANLNRSPTAEVVYNHEKGFEARSAGTHPMAIHRVTQELLDWADAIFVMSEREDKHLAFLKTNFDIEGKEIYDLDISDIYDAHDPVLVGLIKERVGKYLKENI